MRKNTFIFSQLTTKTEYEYAEYSFLLFYTNKNKKFDGNYIKLP